MSGVIPLGECALQPLHAFYEVPPRGLEQEAVMRIHYAIGMNDQLAALTGFAQGLQSEPNIVIALEDFCPAITTTHDVIAGSFISTRRERVMRH